MLRSRADWFALLICLLFIALGCAWISEMGIQTDEALFAGGIYPPYAPGVRLFGKMRPLMLMPYVGTVKSYIWKPLVRNITSPAATIRIPAVLLAGLTVWLFYLLLKRTLGVRTALTGAALLAADATYILTSRWDWGPVVLQHLLTIGGVLAVVRFTEGQAFALVGAGLFPVWTCRLGQGTLLLDIERVRRGYPRHIPAPRPGFSNCTHGNCRRRVSNSGGAAGDRL